MINCLRTTLKALVAAFALASAVFPALAASSDAQEVDRMRATIAANAEKALQKQGGSRLLLKVDADALREAMVTELRDDVYRIVREGKIPFSGLAMRDGGVEIRIAEARDRERVARTLVPPAQAPSGGGAIAVTDAGDGTLRLAPMDAAFAERLRDMVRDSIAMIEELLRDGDIKQAGLSPDGTDRVRVVMPGITDPERVSAMLTKKRQLGFRLVDVSIAPELAQRGAVPESSEVLYGFKDKTPYLLLKDIALTGDVVSYVGPGFDSATKTPIVSFRFNANGARRFAHITQENVGRPFAIVLDDTVLSASVIREPITGGTGQISGNLTLQEANNLAMLLRSATPAGHLILVEQQVVAPGQ
jgi:preprotein translocase subunit SecD